MAGKTGARGGIYTIDLTAPSDQWSLHPVTASEPADFPPHGISLYNGPDGMRRLFALHPRTSGQPIAIFDIAADGTLTLFKTVAAIGSATCRDSVCQYVYLSVFAAS